MTGGVAHIGGVALAEQVNDVEVIDVAGERSNKGGGHDEEHIRQCDVGKLLRCVCAVNARRLILLGGNVLQNTGDTHHGIGDADPDIDNDNRHSRPQGICPEGQILVGTDEAQGAHQLLGSTVVLEHGGNNHQGHELGHGDGNGKDGAPQCFAAGGGALDNHGHDGAQEEVQEGGKECPGDCPAQHTPELAANDAGAVEQVAEVFQPNPVKQNQVTVGLRVVGECHQHHVNQRGNGEGHQQDKGRGHQELVDVQVEQAFHILGKGIDVRTPRLLAGGQEPTADGCPPDGNEQHGNHQRGNRVQQNLLGVIALNILVNKQVVIPDFLGLPPAQAGEHGQPVSAAHGNGHEHDVSDFHCQENQALDQLTGSQIAKPHHQEGQLDPHIPVLKGTLQCSAVLLIGSSDFFKLV